MVITRVAATQFVLHAIRACGHQPVHTDTRHDTDLWNMSLCSELSEFASLNKATMHKGAACMKRVEIKYQAMQRA
jgi:hypothetical protein